MQGYYRDSRNANGNYYLGFGGTRDITPKTENEMEQNMEKMKRKLGCIEATW